MKYEKAEATVIEFDCEDVIMASGQCMDALQTAREEGFPDPVCDDTKQFLRS